MTDPDAESAPVLTYGPAPAWGAVFAGVTLAALAAAVFADVPGRLLAATLAVVAAAAGVADRRASPRLVVSADGVRVGTVTGPHALGWDEVEAVRVDERVRFGRIVHTLELDTTALDAGEALVVLGARALGADPVTVARRIVALAPPTGRAALGGGIRGRTR